MSEPQKIGADRSGLLERYEEAMGINGKTADAKAPEAAEASSDSANNTALKTDNQPEAEHTDTDPKEPVAKEVVASDPGVKKDVEEKGEPKLVPLGALHEAREKIKTKTLEARQLSEKLNAKDQELAAMNTRLAALEETIRKAKAGDVEDAEADETMKLAEENKKLKAEKVQRDQEFRIKTQEDAAKETARLISDADVKLSKEGFPGFQEFGRDVYNAIVAKITAGELEEKDVTTDLWAKVYKEEVYPKKKAIFAGRVEQDKLADKNKLKKAANLARNPGESPAPKEDDNLDAPQSAESYMKARKSIH